MTGRFAVSAHDWPRPHFDLFLEDGDGCRTFRLDAVPTGGTMPAEPLPPHRLVYLEYDGPVSGGRGRVARVDWGTFACVRDTGDALVLRLAGRGGEVVVELRPPGHTLTAPEGQ